jgi:4-amino-4-deoxy-L-arabinose transferase-like glycosyltransferase
MLGMAMPQVGRGARTPRLLFVVWACFLARGAFYAAAFPLWEGYDEWAHFAVIQRMVERHEPLVGRHSPISREVDASLKIAPVPWEQRYLPPPSVTGDAYWRLPADERAGREKQFFSMPAAWAAEDAASGLTAYEALQPPMYYWIAAPVLRIIRGLDLGSRVVLLRWFSVALGSLAIPLCFLAGRVLFSNDLLGLACAAVVAAMPEFLIDIARIGNECAGVVWWSLLIWLLAVAARGGLNRGRAVAIGAVLGAGLLTKAYFLTAIPPVALLLIWDLWSARAKIRPALVRAAATVACAGVISAWWYLRNMLETGTLSGLSESEMLAGKTTAAGLLGRVGEINWPSAVDAILFSHLWFGGWSSLTVRSWMYHVFYLLIALAALGILRQLRHPVVLVLAGVYASFWLGQLYNVLLLYAAKGMATSMGWYMYAVIAAEAALAVAGLRSVTPARLRRYVPLAVISLFVLLDLYTVHGVALPYYSGAIAHRPGGPLAHLRVADAAGIGFGEIFTRLTAYKTGILNRGSLLALWGAYLAATGGLVAAGIRCAAGRKTPDSAVSRLSAGTRSYFSSQGR